jgi:hypothetical protein
MGLILASLIFGPEAWLDGLDFASLIFAWAWLYGLDFASLISARRLMMASL